MTGMRQLGSFIKAILTNPRTMGTIWPSSSQLSDAMAAQVPLNTQGWVVELGAGTGPITKALLARGIDPKRIVAVEYRPNFIRKLRQSFPEIHVLEGDAAHLVHFLSKLPPKPVDAIVSSLPLISLPKATTDKILQQIDQLLSKGGCYIQYTYSYKEFRFDGLKNYQKIFSKRIWLNIPPARVDVFTRLF